MANTSNDQLVADALKSFREQANALADITQSLGKTISQTSSTISKALGDIKGRTSKEQKDNHEINELTFKNKAIEQERNNRKNNNKPLTNGEKESEGWTASGIRTGINTGMNESFSGFLNGDVTSNQLIKGIFHSVKAQLQKQFVELLSETVTNSLMGIITPVANTLDQRSLLEPLLANIQETATNFGNNLQKNTVTDNKDSNLFSPLFENIKSMFSGLGDFLKSNILSPLMDGIKSIWGGVSGLFSGAGSAISGVSSTVGGWASSLGSIVSSFFLASGGHVRGIGTETSDSIPAMLSNNEFVTRAAVVKQPGMLPLLHDINNRGLSALNDYAKRVRHSTGGEAGNPAVLGSTSFNGTSFNENSSAATTVENAVNLHVYDDPQRIINSSFSDGGMESYYLKIERNPQRLRSILGV